VLLNSLTKQREHVVEIVDGRPSEALHRAVLPSGWTSLGLVNHLTFDVERFWFREVLIGETFDDDQETDSVSAWLVHQTEPPRSSLVPRCVNAQPVPPPWGAPVPVAQLAPTRACPSPSELMT
jgi:hypothetical protein